MALPVEALRDLGILVMRVGIGGMFMAYGIPKLKGGPEMWAGIGQAMGNIGITFAPTFWGFMAAAAEGIGGLLLILGLVLRPTAVMMAFTMAMAALFHMKKGDDISGWGHAVELGIVLVALALIGAGRFSLDRLLFRRSEPKPAAG